MRLSACAAVVLAIGFAAEARAQEAVPQNDLLNATLWMQDSVEYKATVLGLFALARIRLDEGLADPAWTALPEMQGEKFGDRPPAIIVDLDETVLDNNRYQASLVTRRTDFSSKEWTKYVNDKVTDAVIGAVDFAKYADAKGVKVFYVSNRTKEEEPATAENMAALGFPMGGNVDTILARGERPDWKSAKESRMKVVADGYRVLLVMGDNLADFTDKASGTRAERNAVLEADMAHWGKDWIMFPNPEYGSWESSAFGGDYKKSADERRKMKIEALKAWEPKS
ncbi:5'-nucleotidase, lipoprotein e(P4) family [Rhizobiales bacterium L72]|uniref:5'-nucleotidase, lipoprotein e(P4) family n=2 Tax=Propylenella binzhouense TaxID=2555902 RepID=A0A964WTP8_9HYPH|nr:5'-nucleotidase, lipoprotein e(P4) family [Propylenella binzhouense]